MFITSEATDVAKITTISLICDGSDKTRGKLKAIIDRLELPVTPFEMTVTYRAKELFADAKGEC